MRVLRHAVLIADRPFFSFSPHLRRLLLPAKTGRENSFKLLGVEGGSKVPEINTKVELYFVCP